MGTRKKAPLQDMPPPGGYAPFQIERIPLRQLFRGRYGVAFLLGINVIGMPLYYKTWKRERIRFIENISSELALLPILWAQQDRTKLKHMKKLRDMEADVMKDFPFWQVGTLLGERVYRSLPENSYMDPIPMELHLYENPADIQFSRTSSLLL